MDKKKEKKIITEDYRTIDDDFNKLLAKNAEEVRKWPCWMLNIWGAVKKDDPYKDTDFQNDPAKLENNIISEKEKSIEYLKKEIDSCDFTIKINTDLLNLLLEGWNAEMKIVFPNDNDSSVSKELCVHIRELLNTQTEIDKILNEIDKDLKNKLMRIISNAHHEKHKNKKRLEELQESLQETLTPSASAVDLRW